MACVWWNLFFVGQNLVWIARLVVKRRHVARQRSGRSSLAILQRAPTASAAAPWDNGVRREAG